MSVNFSPELIEFMKLVGGAYTLYCFFVRNEFLGETANKEPRA